MADRPPAKKKPSPKPKKKKVAATKKVAASKKSAASRESGKPLAKGPARPAAATAPASAAAPGDFDVDALLGQLEEWCQLQQQREVRLLRLPALSEAEIDGIPALLTSFPFPLATAYDPSHFVLPRGYRELLRRAGGLRVEYRGGLGEEWVTWPVVNLYRPGDCSEVHRKEVKTLADSWTVLGTTVDDRAFSTTEFISFADAGFATEASRWCFYLGGAPGLAPSIYIEDNDFECLLGKYVDSGDWISELNSPVFASFEEWLSGLVDVVCSQPLDPDQNDAVVNAIVERGAEHQA